MSRSAVDVLAEQHRHIAELFDAVSDPDVDRPAVLGELVKELAAHVAAERSAVAPVVARRDLGDGELADRLKDDYDRMDRLMVLIERRKANSPDLPEMVIELRDAVNEHNARAEAELFPALRRNLSADEQADLATKVSNADDMVMSHPHPHFLSLGWLGDRMTGLLSRWDRLRDRTTTNLPPTAEHQEIQRKMHEEESRAWKTDRRERGKRERGQSV